MKIIVNVLLPALLLLFAGCSFRTEIPSLDRALISDVLTQIKQEVGVYQAIVQSERRNDIPYSRRIPPVLCDGRADFDVTAVTAVLKANITNSNGLTGGVTAPIAAAGTLGANLTASNSNSAGLILTFNVYPNLPVNYTDTSLVNRPIATALLAFRQAIRAAANQAPCFSTVHDRDKDPANTLELSIEITEKVGGGVDIKLVALDLGVTADRSSVRGNTITVSFRPYDPIREGRAGGDHNRRHNFDVRLPSR